MNRRDFLGALFGTVVITSLSSAATLLEPITPDWQGALNKVYATYMQEFMTFGMAGIRTTDVFPFVEVITAQELYRMPEIQRSLGEF